MMKMGAVKISGLVIVLVVVLVLLGNSLSGFIISSSPPSPSRGSSAESSRTTEGSESSSSPSEGSSGPEGGSSESSSGQDSGGSSETGSGGGSSGGSGLGGPSGGSSSSGGSQEEAGGSDPKPDEAGGSSENNAADAPGLLEEEEVPEEERPCVSLWECSGWGECENGFQYRGCEDLAACEISTHAPRKAQFCAVDDCIEDWQCTWSECSEDNGISDPLNCVDKNNCGTFFDAPTSQACDSSELCVPNVEYTEWSSCDVDYRFVSLDTLSDGELPGVQYRVSSDSNSCIGPTKESRSCFFEKDIEITVEEECETTQIVLSDGLSKEAVARIDADNFNVVLADGGDSATVCTHCLNGKWDPEKGETGVDVGGPCPSYETKYSPVTFEKKSFLERSSFIGSILDWFRNIFG